MLIKLFRYIYINGIIKTFKVILGKGISLIRFGRLDIRIGRFSKIEGFANISLGKNFQAGKHLWLSAISECNGIQYNSSIIIKDDVCMHDFIHIGAIHYVEIGNNVLMASKIYISDHNHGCYSGKNQSSPLETPCSRVVNNDSKVVIGDNVWIGEMVSILPGVSIGEGSVIGSNAVVTKNIPPYSIAAGNPAKIIKQYNFEKNEWQKID